MPHGYVHYTSILQSPLADIHADRTQSLKVTTICDVTTLDVLVKNFFQASMLFFIRPNLENTHCGVLTEPVQQTKFSVIPKFMCIKVPHDGDIWTTCAISPAHCNNRIPWSSSSVFLSGHFLFGAQPWMDFPSEPAWKLHSYTLKTGFSAAHHHSISPHRPCRAYQETAYWCMLKGVRSQRKARQLSISARNFYRISK